MTHERLRAPALAPAQCTDTSVPVRVTPAANMLHTRVGVVMPVGGT
jgi:hypothetical protein